MQCVAVCCTLLQCVAVCLSYVAVCCSVVQCASAMLQCVAVAAVRGLALFGLFYSCLSVAGKVCVC